MKDEKATPRDGRPTPHDPAIEPDGAVDTHPGVHGGPPLTPKVPAEQTTADDEAAGALADRVQPTSGTRTLRTARLGDLEGLGLIIVLRDADGKVVGMDGSWRPADETLSLEDLQQAFPEDSVATFTGTQVESGDDRAAEDVSAEVVIKRFGEYVRDDGGTLRLVNFSRRDTA